MAQVVLSDVAESVAVQPGTLFRGLKFWLSHKVPQRSRFINDIRANGGEILPIEKHADVKIVDHAKKEALPGTHSYTFIEKSIRNGVLEDLQDHRAGPPEGTVRSVGSIIQPAKGIRNKYTQDDDRILWNWVHDNPQRGGGTDGNEIYKQLEAKHPQHPWQSWRDRWIKQLKGKPCPFPVVHNAPPTPPSDIPPVIDASAATKEPKISQTTSGNFEDIFASFDEDDAEALLSNGAEIMKVPDENMAEAWKLWARDCDEQQVHTAHEWRSFWEEHVRPRYLKRLAKQYEGAATAKRTTNTSQVSTPSQSHKIESQPSISPPTKTHSNDKTLLKSLSHHPESPSMQLVGPSHYQRRLEETYLTVDTEAASPQHGSQHDSESDSAAEIVSATVEKIKRKRAELEEEFPSSSPPEGVPSPKRIRQTTSESVREIASTPDRTPVHSGNRPDSPLFIASDDDEEEEGSDSEDDMAVEESDLGKQPSETLSEPGHVVADTQDIFHDTTQHIDFDLPPPEKDSDDGDPFLREPTQAIDFEVPPPDDGWDDEDSGAEASSESGSTGTEIYDPRPMRQGTQALLRGQTVAPDFNIPEPEGGWDYVIQSSSPPASCSPLAESEISDVDAQTEVWINAHTTDGVTVDDVLSALKCTSMDTSLAEMVIESMKKNMTVPKDQRGVWTETDDEDLECGTDARKLQRLEVKHGKDGVNARWDFLNFYRRA